MTGMVKEEILTRQAEIGLSIENGCLVFNPLLLDPEELLTAPTPIDYLDIAGQSLHLELAAGSLAVTFCQVPVILQTAGQWRIEVYFVDGTIEKIEGNVLDSVNTRHIFSRNGKVRHLLVSFKS